MVFKRRDKLTWPQRLRDIFFPRKGWRRGLTYMGHRVKRIQDTPHKIALGAALGILVCFTPVFGLHMILAVVFAYLLRANIVAALILTWFANPVTLPIIAVGSLNLGRWIMGVDGTGPQADSIMGAFQNAGSDLWAIVHSWFGGAPASTEGLRAFFFEIFIPYALGGAIIGVITAGLTYTLVRPAITAYQARRRARLSERRANHKRAAHSDADSAA